MGLKTRVKTWVKEVLTFADLNDEFDNLFTTPLDLIALAPATVVWDIGSLATGTQEVKTGIAVTGAALGDFVLVSCSTADTIKLSFYGWVDSADTVSIVVQNNGTSIDLASQTFKVRVIPNT